MKQKETTGSRKAGESASRSDSAKKIKPVVTKSTTHKIRKHDLKSAPLCKVTFKLPKEAVQGAKTVTIVGDFNNWNVTQTPMKKLKNGSFTLTLELPCNREFNFRYLLDASRWENDWFADKYVPNDFGDENSVLVL